MRQADGSASPYAVGTVERAFALITVLADTDRPLALNELVAKLELSKPTVYRLVRTLVAHGVLRQVPSEGYVLGPALISIGQAALRATRLPEIGLPYLQQVHEELGETVVMSVLDGDEIVYVARIQARQILGVRGEIGARLPAYCTSSGQSLLSGLSDEDVRSVLVEAEMERVAPNTITSIDDMLARLEEVRKRGYAINDEELEMGHRAVAVPIRDHADQVCAAFSVSVPVGRVSVTQLKRFAKDTLIPTAAAMSAELGSSAHQPAPVAALT
jgi:IclR family acetate operon transcriptional repressor